MSSHVEDFDVHCTDTSISGADCDLAIYGTPFHESKDAILQSYVDRTNEKFFHHEQLRSCGNYLLFDGRDPDSVHIITSPGFCSGYFYAGPSSVRAATLLTNVLQTWKENNGKIEERYLKLFLDKQRPFQGTPFDGIQQLRPATSYTIESGTVVENSSYLHSRSDASFSVERGMRNCAAALSGNSVTVMFSGGLDSLSWYLVLASELGESNVNLATVDWRPGSEGQGPYLAKPVAEELGIDLDIVSFEDGWLTDKRNVVDHITNWMRKDFTIGRNPNHALVDMDNLNDVVVNLTNNESLINLQMNHLYTRKFINKSNTMRRNLNMAGYLLFKQYIHNLPYTAKYMRNWILRPSFFAVFWPLARLANALHPREVPIDLSTVSFGDIDLSEEAIQRSIIGKTAPNIKPKKHAEIIDQELESLVGIVNQTDIHHLTRVLYYYAHMAYTSNNLEKMPIAGQDVRTYLPTTWGPMLPLLFGDLTLKDAIHPRYQLLDIVKSETGRSFADLRPLADELTTDTRKSTAEYVEDVYSSVINAHGDLLTPKTSVALQYMSGEMSNWYKKELRESTPITEDGRGSFWDVLKTSRMLNIELLLRNFD